MTRASSKTVACLGLLLALARCAKDPTALYIEVTLQQGPPMTFDHGRVRVFDATTQVEIPGANVATSMVMHSPYTIVVDSTGAHSRVTVEVALFERPNSQSPAAVGRVTASFTSNAVMKVPVVLYTGCHSLTGMGAPAIETCPVVGGMMCGPPLSACPPDQTCTPMGRMCAPSDAVSVTRYNY